MELTDIAADRRRLREQWRRLGYHAGQSIPQLLLEGARRHPDVESIYYAEKHARRTTNRELYAHSLRIAASLRQLGVGRGDVVAVQLPTWYETTVLYLALMHVGAIVLPIVSIYGTAEVEFILRQSQAKLYFSPAKWRALVSSFSPTYTASAPFSTAERTAGRLPAGHSSSIVIHRRQDKATSLGKRPGGNVDLGQ